MYETLNNNNSFLLFLPSTFFSLLIPKEPETVSLPNRIFVSRIPPGMTQVNLRDYFVKYGEIEDVFVPNPPRGFAFVTFRDLDVAEKLVDGQHLINNVSVNVSLAMTKDSCFAAGLGKGEDGIYKIT